jgi:hypothetical protein
MRIAEERSGLVAVFAELGFQGFVGFNDNGHIRERRNLETLKRCNLATRIPGSLNPATSYGIA